MSQQKIVRQYNIFRPCSGVDGVKDGKQRGQVFPQPNGMVDRKKSLALLRKPAE
jgi:hypothetical protein